MELLKQVGAFDEYGNEVIAKDNNGQEYSVAKHYFEKLFEYLKSLEGSDHLPDFAALQDFATANEKFNADSVLEFLQQTSLIGLLFIDFAVNENADHELTIKKLSPDSIKGKEEKIILENLDDAIGKVFMDFGFGKKLSITANETTLHYHPIAFQTATHEGELRYLGLRGHTLQMPIFNLFDFELTSPIEVTKKLEREEVDRSIISEVKKRKDTSNEKIDEQRKAYHRRGFGEAKITSKTHVNLVLDKDRKPYLSKDKKTGKYRTNYVFVINSSGWHIIAGDRVQLFGNEKEYIVEWVDKNPSLEHKCIKVRSTDPDAESFHIYPDDVSAVTTRYIANKMDQANSYYGKAKWYKKVQEALADKEAKEKLRTVKSKKEKVMPFDRLNTEHLDYDNYLFAVYTYDTDQNFQDVVTNSDQLTIITSQAEMDDYLSENDNHAGVVILRVDRSKKQFKERKVGPDGKEQKDLILKFIKDKRSKGDDIFGYVQNVLLIEEQKIDFGEEDLKKEKEKKAPAKKAEKEAIVKPYGDYTAEEYAELPVDSYPVFKSAEEARNAGFKSNVFFLVSTDEGVIPYPKLSFYTKNGLPTPNLDEPILDVGDTIQIYGEIKGGINPELARVTISKVDSDFYYYTDDKNIERTLPRKEVDNLYGIKYELTDWVRDDDNNDGSNDEGTPTTTNSPAGLLIEDGKLIYNSLYERSNALAMCHGQLKNENYLDFFWELSAAQCEHAITVLDEIYALSNNSTKAPLILLQALHDLQTSGKDVFDILPPTDAENENAAPDDVYTIPDWYNDYIVPVMQQLEAEGNKPVTFSVDHETNEVDGIVLTEDENNNCTY